ncbi:uncharacterized protein LOC114748723 [Neltuma alba]|uniref:uncharacterized protein LOC114748723 n=1 Tax=Neltuma alba TaxID=207710 RepID=UPI0010A32CC0|nr:uncharacterized protein LOC114748723 [Prosopis alba]
MQKAKVEEDPKRGPGVAQLEKMRVEEQQKKDEVIASSAILPPLFSVSSSKSSYLVRSIPKFEHYDQPSFSPISFPSLPLRNVDDNKVSNTVIVPGHGIVSEFRGSDENNDFEKSSVVEHGLVFLSSLPHESNSNSIRPLPKWVRITQPRQQPPSSMVNGSSGTSSTPSLRYSIMEPPSNQNQSGHWMPLQMQPEKMIGMKRSYPFSQDVPPAPFNFRLPTIAAPMKMNETCCGSGSGFYYAANATFREVPSSSTSNLEANSKRLNTVNENFNGGILAVSTPTPTSSSPPSKSKSPPTVLAFHNQEYPQQDSHSCQGIVEGQITQAPVFSRFNQLQQPFYIFIPPVAKAAQVGQTAARTQNGNGVRESVDLNLKL